MIGIAPMQPEGGGGLEMGLGAILRRAFGRAQAAAPLSETAPPPSLRPVVLPVADAAETVAETVHAGPVTVIGALVEIEYSDTDGVPSERRIAIRKVQRRADGDGYVQAFCHERRAMRTFRISRIESLVDMETGEVFDDPLRFFAEELAVAELAPERPKAAQDDTTEAAIARYRPQMQILAGLAHCDGHFHPEQKRLMVDFISDRAGLPLNRDRLTRYVGRLRGSQGTVADAIELLAEDSDEEIVALVEAFGPMIEADGVVHANELAFARAFVGSMREAGVQLNIDLPTG